MHPAASSPPKPAKAPPRATRLRPPAQPSPGAEGGRPPAARERAARVTFGSATVTTRRPTRAEAERAVEASTEALRRAGERLARPGIRLPARKDVPLFQADPENPGRFLRTLNGRTERGVLEGGRFTVTD
ncbi:hypothetical protein EAH89_24345 [Roseomonas nepalensis]|uniref:Uncharacterized protein n=1 Tax=Muricoccus nepalensis TaxID=1854500 RepID=A0A502FCA7_9PROT|nr:hypothetical protein [Roseomonas nepalensis]TPG46933.1 hypothetical protein EAH89_24345 [Roseomonas nepalensis]